MEKQLHISDLVALWLSLISLLLCIPCFRLQDRDSLWRKYPHRILIWYIGACLLHTICGLIMHTLLPACSAVGSFLSNYCEIQRYVLICLMLHWLRRFELGLLADKTIWIAFVAPLPICMWAPQPVTKTNCILDGGEANRFNVIVGLAFFVLLAGLTLAGLCRKGEAETPMSPRSPQRTTEDQPSLASFQFESANNLVEFEPDSPTCYQHLGTSRIERNRNPPTLQLSPPIMDRRNLEMHELASAELQDRFFVSGDSQRTALANLKLAILVIATKCTIVLTISTLVRSTLFFQPFHAKTESALVFGLMVELLLENTEGCFVLLLVLSLFETQWSQLTRELRQRHRMARSRAQSLNES